MEQLKLYITLLRHNCVTIAHQALEKLDNGNRILFDMDSNIIYMDGDWWCDFIMSHTLDICDIIILHLRIRYKAKHLHLVFKDLPIAYYTWNEDAKMYLVNNDGYYKQN